MATLLYFPRKNEDTANREELLMISSRSLQMSSRSLMSSRSFRSKKRRSSVETMAAVPQDLNDSMSSCQLVVGPHQCGTCGIQTHDVKIVKTKSRRSFLGFSKKENLLVPLTVQDSVLNGRCLACHPLLPDTSESQETRNEKEDNVNDYEHEAAAPEKDIASSHGGEDKQEDTGDGKEQEDQHSLPVSGMEAATEKIPSDFRTDTEADTESCKVVVPAVTEEEEQEQESPEVTAVDSNGTEQDPSESKSSDSSESEDETGSVSSPEGVPPLIRVDSTELEECLCDANPAHWPLPWPLNRTNGADDDVILYHPSDDDQENEDGVTMTESTQGLSLSSLHLPGHLAVVSQDTSSSASSALQPDRSDDRSIGDRSMSVADLTNNPSPPARVQQQLLPGASMSKSFHEVSMSSILHMSEDLKGSCASKSIFVADLIQAPDVATWLQDFVEKCRESDQFRAEAAVKGGIEAVLSVMRMYKHNASIQQQGCLALHALARGHGTAIAKQRGVDCLLWAIKQHGEANHRLLGYACGALMYVVMNDSYKGVVARKGGVAAILVAMEHHIDNLHVQQQCFAALLRLSSHRTIIDELTNSKHQGIQRIVDSMNHHSDDVLLLQFGSGILKNMAQKETSIATIVDEGGAAALVSAIRSHPKSENLQQQACWALYELAATEDIAQVGAVGAVITAMETHNNNAKIQQYGCGVLKHLTVTRPNICEVAKLNGITTILNAMRKHINNAELQRYGLGALKHLSMSGTNEKSIAKKGGIAIVIEAMKAHGFDGSVQREGCGALRNLSVHDGCKSLIGGGGVLAILVAMKLTPNDASLQQKACGTLLNLSRSQELSRTIASYEGVFTIVSTMKHLVSDAKLQQYACGTLKNLAVTEELKKTVADKGGIQAIIAAMNRHVDDAKLQSTACGALKNLAGTTENKQTIAKHQGIITIVSAMKKHASDVAVQQEACAALLALSVIKELSVSIGKHEGIHAILACIERHSKSSKVLGSAFGALWNLSTSSANLEIIKEHSGVNLLVSGMKVHVSIAGVQGKACLALANLAASASCRSLMVEVGAIAAVINAMKFHERDAQVQKYACKFLVKMLQDEEATKEVVKGASAVEIALQYHAGNPDVEKYVQKVLEGISHRQNEAKRGTPARVTSVAVEVEC